MGVALGLNLIESFAHFAPFHVDLHAGNICLSDFHILVTVLLFQDKTLLLCKNDPLSAQFYVLDLSPDEHYIPEFVRFSMQ